MVFHLDKISKLTINEDYSPYLNENNNFILKRKNWEINNYQRFIDIVNETPRVNKGFLTYHGMDEITQKDWITYTLKGYDIAFALHFIDDGQVDICNLVNNSDLRNVGSLVLQFAKSEGGTQMDNFRGHKSDKDPEGHGKLGNLYRSQGFDRQTWSDDFNPDFQPEDPEWQLDKHWYNDEGEAPGVEGLELSKHRRKYNDPTNKYKAKWDKRIGNKFK